jgi:PelA/Pel-15E family pectate lyase
MATILLLAPVPAPAAVVGTNVPAVPLTDERVAGNPEWRSYLENSRCHGAADLALFEKELRDHGMKAATSPPESRNASCVDLGRADDWYATPKALRIATNLLSFQTPSGGWGKNTDFSRSPRNPGELFGAGQRMAVKGSTPGDFDEHARNRWSYVGTFDNDATTTELRFLAKVITASKNPPARMKEGFRRGLDYILAAQYPNGGWPQVWPLEGGYHDAITINDNAMIHLVEFLRDVSRGEGCFAFVPEAERKKADASWRKGLECLLKAQIRVRGGATVWAQQYDPLTLEPAAARNYEMPAACSSESAHILLFLMSLPDPDPATIAAVHSAAGWFGRTRITGKEFSAVGPEGKTLHDNLAGEPIWARYYQVGTDQPLFGDRDKTIHDDVNEISRERRNGYAWFGTKPGKALELYAAWAPKHPRPQTAVP